MKEYAVIYEQGETNWGAMVPDLPGCVSIGDTFEEVQLQEGSCRLPKNCWGFTDEEQGRPDQLRLTGQSHGLSCSFFSQI